MEGESNVKRTDEYNSVVFMSDNSRLSVKGGAVTFTSEGAGEIKSSEEARAYAEGVIERINEYFGNYKFHSMYSTDEGWSVKFYEKNEGYSVFSNFAYFTIKGSNIALSLNYMKTGSELNVKNDIYAADEALYSAVPLIEKEKGRTNVSDVELGYYAVKSGTEEIATPFYLIVSEGKEYYVNAYTGECF